nr:hypothetical protein [uncultured Prevotella sp.]
MSKKEKFYFRHKYSEDCYRIEDLIKEAKKNEETEIEVYEAVPDHSADDIVVFCNLAGTFEDAEYCKERWCDHYKSKSGHRKCIYRDCSYMAGKKVTFKVE